MTDAGGAGLSVHNAHMVGTVPDKTVLTTCGFTQSVNTGIPTSAGLSGSTEAGWHTARQVSASAYTPEVGSDSEYPHIYEVVFYLMEIICWNNVVAI